MSDELKQAAWDNVPGVGLRKKDHCGAWISWDDYHDRSDPENEGWEIDHITPVSKGGEDKASNVRALHWKNNVLKSNGSLPRTKCVIADGNNNVDNS